MIIQHNLPATNALRQTGINNRFAGKNLEKLSSGYKVNRAGDDAAGLAISEKMRGQIRGLTQAQKNVTDGISFAKTADGAMQTDHELLQRIRELLVQASNGTYDETDRNNLQKEVDQLMQEIDDISYRAEFNGLKVLRTNWFETVQPSMPGKTVLAELPANYNPQYTEHFGYIEVPAGGADFYINFNNLIEDGQTWPDLNIIAPNGDKFGYTWTYLNSGSPVSTTGAASCDKAEYTGYTPPVLGGPQEEEYKFTNAMEGKWIIVLRNAISKPSTFNLNSDLEIVPYTTGTEGGGDPLIISKEPGPLYIQAGANGNETIIIPVSTIDTSTLGLQDKDGKSRITVTPVSKAAESIGFINNAINYLSGKRADIGAVQNRLEHTLNNLGVTTENLQAAESSIRDVDMAKEMMEFTKNTILAEASQSMLAQANQLPQSVLNLLKAA